VDHSNQPLNRGSNNSKSLGSNKVLALNIWADNKGVDNRRPMGKCSSTCQIGMDNLRGSNRVVDNKGLDSRSLGNNLLNSQPSDSNNNLADHNKGVANRRPMDKCNSTCRIGMDNSLKGSNRVVDNNGLDSHSLGSNNWADHSKGRLNQITSFLSTSRCHKYPQARHSKDQRVALLHLTLKPPNRHEDQINLMSRIQGWQCRPLCLRMQICHSRYHFLHSDKTKPMQLAGLNLQTGLSHKWTRGFQLLDNKII
jgi:hypothetical protein